MTDLFPEWCVVAEPSPARIRRTVRSVTGRKQYRRQEWEDATEPTAWPGVYRVFGLPLPTPSNVRPGPDKVAVLMNRHANREQLWNAKDRDAVPVNSEDALCLVMKENASGIEELPNNVPRVNPFRAHPWDGTRHIHLGYFEKWEQACYAVRLWHACCGTTDDDGIDCAKWFPQGDWTEETLAKLTEVDIERIARARRF